jgi:hypothetical protein
MRASSLTAVSTPVGLRRSKRAILVLDREHGIYRDRHLARARGQQGFGWEQWSRQWLYDTLKLFNGYRVRHGGSKVAPV